jgi:hypothetical protein
MGIKIKAALVGVAVSAATLLGTAAPASALSDGQWTYCTQNDDTLCLFWTGGDTGSHIGLYGKVNDYNYNNYSCNVDGCAIYVFKSSGGGQGTPVKNDAESVYNNDPTSVYYVYYNSWEGGAADTVDPEYLGNWDRNLSATYNNNASQQAQWGG